MEKDKQMETIKEINAEGMMIMKNIVKQNLKQWIVFVLGLLVVLCTSLNLVFGAELGEEEQFSPSGVGNGNAICCVNVWSATGSGSTEPMVIYYNNTDAGAKSPQIMYLNDENINSIFCIWYGAALSSGNVIEVCDENAYQRLNEQQKNAIASVLGCTSMRYAPRDGEGGYTRINTGDCTFANFQMYQATQLMIWYYIDLYSGNAGNGNTGGITWDGVVRSCQAGWGNLQECERIKEAVTRMNEIPSFTNGDLSQSPVYEMRYNPGTAMYESFVYDDKQVLNQFRIIEESEVECIRCDAERNPDEAGSYLLIRSKDPIGNAEHPVPITFLKEKVVGNVMYLINKTEPQDLGFFSEEAGRQVLGYIRVYTEANPTLSFVKRDSDTKEIVTGVTLQILDDSRNVVHEWKTTDVAYEVNDLSIGKTYTLHEKEKAAGYVTGTDVTFTVSSSSETIEIVMYNTKTTTEIRKIDVATGEELPGAKLELYQGDNLIESWISTEEPHVIYGLTTGTTYTLKESLAPLGYATAESIDFVIEDTAEVQKVVMENAYIKGNVSLIKLNAKTGDALEGAVFKLFKLEEDEDVLIGSYKSDKQGKIKVYNLLYGNYYFLETEAPANYIISEEIYPFVIDEAHTEIQIQAENEEATTTEVPPVTTTEQEPETETEASTAVLEARLEKTPVTGDQSAALPVFLMLIASGIVFVHVRKK